MGVGKEVFNDDSVGVGKEVFLDDSVGVGIPSSLYYFKGALSSAK